LLLVAKITDGDIFVRRHQLTLVARARLTGG